MSLEHIQYIIDNYSDQLKLRLESEGRKLSVDRAMDVLSSCDPSKGKKLVDWLVRTYIDRGFRWEDVETGTDSKLAEVLGLYKTYFSQIPREQRSIYIYQNYGELYRLIEPYISKKSMGENIPGSREIKRKERNLALEESEVLYKSEDMIVAVPLTEFASKWWGRGTKWCTAGDKNNYFNQYNQDAPLIIITLLNPYSSLKPNLDSVITSLKNSLDQTQKSSIEKFQLWTDGESIQFMDALDAPIIYPTIMNNWKFFEPILLGMIKHNGLLLNYIPEYFRIPEICRDCVQQNGMALDYVPEGLKTVELCWLAVEQNGLALNYVPYAMRTADLCMKAVKQNGFAINKVPGGLKSLELCSLAVQQNGIAIDYVPYDFKTFEIIEQAIKQNGLALGSLHPSDKTEEMCWQAIRQNGLALAYVRDDMKTREMCEISVRQNGLALCYVPYSFMNQEICTIAFNQSSKAINSIPLEYRTSEMFDVIDERLGRKWEDKFLVKLKADLKEKLDQPEHLILGLN